MLRVGSLVDGKYRILNEIGRGGMSVVYLALNERMNKTWAIKELRRDGIENYQVVRQGLIVETDLLKKLDNPHLPRIIDVIDQEDSFLIVMDYIEGRTLKDKLDEEGAQGQEEVIGWGRQLCEVLCYLHACNPPIIYRDLKPSNIMLKPDGSLVLIDFGTAREYKRHSREDTTCLGTRGYAAPEQYGGQGQTDARTDIYCLGATLYHLLTGHNPGEPPYELYPIRYWDQTLSVGMENIIRKCTQQNPEDRYGSCEELQYALEAPYREDGGYRRRQKARLAGFLAAAVMAAGFGIAAGIFAGLKSAALHSGYQACMAAARNATGKEEEIENYCNAIRLDPGDNEAWLGLLQEAFLDDGCFTAEESELLRAVMIECGKTGITNEAALMKNTEDYAVFSYEAGIAYYYYYETDGKKNAKSYFTEAMNASSLSSAQTERARILCTISDYYARIGIADATGDATITYRDYWNDLVEVSGGNLVEADNARTALIMYGELVSQIISRATEFREDGVTQQEMESLLEHIRTHLETDFQGIRVSEKELLREEIETLECQLLSAERILKAAFSQEEDIEKVVKPVAEEAAEKDMEEVTEEAAGEVIEEALEEVPEKAAEYVIETGVMENR